MYIHFRKCNACKKTFFNDRGLRKHERNPRNVQCYRFGILRTRNLYSRNAPTSKKYGQLPKNHENLFEKHPKGTPFDVGDKRTALNVYQKLVDRFELSQIDAIRQTSILTGIYRDSIKRYAYKCYNLNKPVLTNEISQCPCLYP